MTAGPGGELASLSGPAAHTKAERRWSLLRPEGVKPEPLPQEFYLQDAAQVAEQILGKTLVHETKSGRLSGTIVEAEAYLSRDDPGCHAARGKTKRNAFMFAQGGVAYVYFIYGMYYCFNVVTGQEGRGEAVLIRAAAPLEGVSLMAQNRGRQDPLNLLSGPGKLCQAFQIDLTLNGQSLQERPLFMAEGEKPPRVTVTTRIGLNLGKEKLLRYYVTGSPFVSRP